jgi:hypothetical protein
VTWTKLGDEFAPEAAVLSDPAFRTHVEALCWSNMRLLDLMIAKRDLKRFAETPEPQIAVNELVASGWWEDRGDEWWIGCKWPDWQRDKVQVEHRRQTNGEAQRRRRRHAIGDHSLCLDSCKEKSPSSDDTPDDSSRHSPDDPGRDGAGRAGTLTTSTSNSSSKLSTDVGKKTSQLDGDDEDGWANLNVAQPGQGFVNRSGTHEFPGIARVAAEEAAKTEQSRTSSRLEPA